MIIENYSLSLQLEMLEGDKWSSKGIPPFIRKVYEVIPTMFVEDLIYYRFNADVTKEAYDSLTQTRKVVVMDLYDFLRNYDQRISWYSSFEVPNKTDKELFDTYINNTYNEIYHLLLENDHKFRVVIGI